jgi:hypothetical protein
MAFLFQDQNQGTRNDDTCAKPRGKPPQPFSFIRTLTVGLGIAPNLLTLPLQEGARGLGLLHPYRRWGLSPRPENGSIFRQSGRRFAAENAPNIKFARILVAKPISTFAEHARTIRNERRWREYDNSPGPGQGS